MNSKADHVFPKTKKKSTSFWIHICIIQVQKKSLCHIKMGWQASKDVSVRKARSDFYHSSTFGTWKSSEAFDLSSEGNLRGGEPLVRRVPFNEVTLERPWFGIKAALCLKRAKLTGCRPVSPLWNGVFTLSDSKEQFSYHTISALKTDPSPVILSQEIGKYFYFQHYINV